MGVFLSAQAVVFHQSAPCHAGGGTFADLFRYEFSRPTNLLGCWLRFILRRHFTGVDSEYDFVPLLCDLRIRKIGREVVQTEPALLFLFVVAPQAMGFEEATQGVFGIFGDGGVDRRQDQDAGEKKQGDRSSAGRRRRTHGRGNFLERSRLSGFSMNSS